IAVAAGDAEGVVQSLEQLTGEALAVPEGVHGWRADLAEALVALERSEDAASLLDRPGEIGDDPHALAGILRARATLAAASGRASEAEALLGQAIGSGVEASGAFVHARAELALGALLRRQGQRRRAAVHLEHARSIFRRLGA